MLASSTSVRARTSVSACACVQACVDAFLHACMHACVRACVHACVRACVHACVRFQLVRPCERVCVHAYDPQINYIIIPASTPNIDLAPMSTKARAPTGTRARAAGGQLSHGGKSWHGLDHRHQWARSGTRRAPEPRRQILTRTRPQAPEGIKGRASMRNKTRASGGHLSHGAKS